MRSNKLKGKMVIKGKKSEEHEMGRIKTIKKTEECEIKRQKQEKRARKMEK